jgi:CRISPR/Cas system-associated endonuclease/helicase Cas3
MEGTNTYSNASHTNIVATSRFIGLCAPTGSGKSGAFIIPALFLSHPSQETYYQYYTQNNNNNNDSSNQINRQLSPKVSNNLNDNQIINRPQPSSTSSGRNPITFVGTITRIGCSITP